jgi:hypothetical protein
MTKQIFRIAALAVVLAGMATADDRWVHFFDGGDRTSSDYDSETVQYRASNKFVKVWVKDVDPSGTYVFIHIELYAPTQQWHALSMTKYDAKGAIIKSYSEPSPTWDDIIPESLGDALLHRLFRADKGREQ